MLADLIVRRDEELVAFLLDKLVGAAAGVALLVRHAPLLHGAHGEVLAQEDVEGGVDLCNELVAHKRYAIKALQNHANLLCRVPLEMTTCPEP